MIKRFLSSFSLQFPVAIAYMLQSTEYDRVAYVKWLNQVSSFSQVMNRRTLDHTAVARAFVVFMKTGIALQLLAAATLLAYGIVNKDLVTLLAGAGLILIAPTVWSYLVVIPLYFARRFILDRKLRMYQAETKRIIDAHKAVKIAVAGSFGKTTMKELLATVLAEGKTVASTPGNKNVTSAHYDFARGLTGDEDVIIVEFGEGKPGDVERFSETISPDIAVITGIAPAHLDQYADINEAATDIFSVAKHLPPGNVYVNSESHHVSKFIKDDYIGFDSNGLEGWRVNGVTIDLNGTHFVLKNGTGAITVESGLIGKHLIGVMSATAIIAKRIGLTNSEIEAGFKKTIPYQHRMQPYRIGGAWVIDDSYNGNLQGIKAGTELLGSLPAKRKVYVTPGLVDQGADTSAIHQEVGTLIANAHPDIVVLMKNSVTNDIIAGLKSAGYTKELLVQSDPLMFYKNLDQFVAGGDIVMLQNDWTDNYL